MVGSAVVRAAEEAIRDLAEPAEGPQVKQLQAIAQCRPGASYETIHETARRALVCDLVIWVVPAHRADREIDRAALAVAREPEQVVEMLRYALASAGRGAGSAVGALGSSSRRGGALGWP